ncbi:MAG TPA: FRG domain-containing protein, partial [Verrucomicrobiae bacterium]|nr:FRG domain-containing protein [Verrucomicrobiae bacterium]
MSVKRTTIQSLGELLDRTTPSEPDQASGRLREDSVYRGVADMNSRLLTSLDRLGGIESPHSKRHLEEHLLRNFIRYGAQFLPKEPRTLWQVMVIAAHQGLPTRLLDWTHSPLVAAHFATLNPSASSDRVIWKLNWKQVHRGFGLREVAFLLEDLEPVLSERGFERSWDF